MQIALDKIEVSRHRLRDAVPVKVDEIAASMNEIGQLYPIIVRLEKKGRTLVKAHLIAGVQRYHAAKQLGWTEIECQESLAIGENQERIVEIDENLKRADLTPDQRAEFIRERARIERLPAETVGVGISVPTGTETPTKKSHPKKAVEGAKKGRKKGSKTKGSVRDVAEKTSQPKSVVHRAVTTKVPAEPTQPLAPMADVSHTAAPVDDITQQRQRDEAWANNVFAAFDLGIEALGKPVSAPVREHVVAELKKRLAAVDLDFA